MLIIIEGPDGAGKTTLAKKLSSSTSKQIVHCGSALRKKSDFYSYTKQQIILDRSWYSELVYGEVFREGSQISEEEMFELEMSAEQVSGALIIYCRADLETLWKRCKNTEPFTKKQVSQVLEEYDKLLLNSFHIIPVVVYDTSESGGVKK